MFDKHPQELFDVVGEMLDSFTEMVDTMTGLMYIYAPPQSYRLSLRNRLLLVLMWLRSYSCFSVVALLFDVSPGTICYEISRIWAPLERNIFSIPSRREWENLKGQWSQLPGAMGAIDETSHRIYINHNLNHKKNFTLDIAVTIACILKSLWII